MIFLNNSNYDAAGEAQHLQHALQQGILSSILLYLVPYIRCLSVI
jgi:hypothetical protein